MSNPFRSIGPVFRLLTAAAFATSSCLTSASAQTAPQLLPYTSKLIAGSGTATIASGANCPVSGLTSTDAYGDGCLATEIQLVSPRYATVDKLGNVFFSDWTNGLVRRIDSTTGIVTAIAGGAASSPAAATACGLNLSLDANGDGCAANLVKLSKPAGLAFSTAGDLYFSDNGYDTVRKIAATGGVITTTGIITNIAGNVTTFGYNVNNTSLTGPVNAATQSYLNFPYGIAFDAAGNLYIADEGNNAIEVVNLTSATETLQGMTLLPGTIAKFSGYGSLAAKNATVSDCPDFVSTSARGGCYFGKWTDGALANVSNNDGVYGVAIDSSANVYFANEFNDDVGLITSGNVISNYAGVQASAGAKPTLAQRGVAGSFGIGSIFGVALDSSNNLYATDASSGLVWRVDSGSKAMYSIAGGASSVCTSATDTLGDGCPATQATFGSSGTGNFASTTAPGPGIFGIAVDAYSDLFLGDTETNVIREIASGTQFGPVGVGATTQTIEVHFAANDSAVNSGGYAITSGAAIFSLGTPACTTHTDKTTDCTLALTVTPVALGAFTGTLTVTSQLGGAASFALSGSYVQSPTTRTAVSYTTPVACTGSTTYSTATPVTISAILTANGPSAPTGTITFFSNGTAIGTPQTVTNLGTTAAPSYGAKLANTFSTATTYTLTATYSGDSYFKTSSGQAPATITTSGSTFTAAPVSYMTTCTVNGLAVNGCVVAGQTSLYSFTLNQSVFSGSITMACSGLPQSSSCVFSPAIITASGCSTTNTVAFSILTSKGASNSLSSFGGNGRGLWSLIGIVSGVFFALLIGIRRRRSPLRYGQLWMALALLVAGSGLLACSTSTAGGARTPAGSYTVTVTATGSTGTSSSFTVPLTVQ